MRSLNTKLVFTALGILTMVASPTFAQEPRHHRHASLTSVPVGQSRRAIYNMVINPVDDPALTGGGSVGYNELEREDNSGGG